MKQMAAAAALLAAGLMLSGCSNAVAGAPVPDSLNQISDTGQPHEVTYTVTADTDSKLTVMYLSTEPEDESAFQEAKASFLTMKTVTVGPSQPWTLDVGLTNPKDHAFVEAAITGEVRINLHCKLAVDNVVLEHQDKQDVVKCPDRNW